jgi:serine/threonine protein kinase
MSARPPAVPPQISGFEHVRHLGSGGFADVFLYEQPMLGRKVAVKVLLSGRLVADALANFTNEANLMAQLSNHPSIVSVYQAGISEDGRPFIVMEYCSRPNLQTRYRAARFSEAETLRIGIQTAGAVETAHRAGILHRDIKPANILVTDYGRPALTDFGIAATTASGAQAGFSVPWAPPESFRTGSIGDERSDIYSLAATLYTLLAGRTPFELPGAPNSSVDIMGRIQAGSLPAIGRQDVSPTLERALAIAMAPDASARYSSAMEFARALQRVQIERGMQPTTVDVIEEAADVVDHEEDEGLTRIRSVVTIEAQPPLVASGPATRPSFETSPAVDTQKAYRPAPLGVPSAPPVEDTQLRVPDSVIEVSPDVTRTAAPRRSRGRVFALAGAGVAVVAIGVLIGMQLLGGQKVATAEPNRPTLSAAPIDPLPGDAVAPKVEGLTGTVKGGVATFTWKNPDPKDGDSYLWRLIEPGVKHTYAPVQSTSVAVPRQADGRTCIEVVLRRATGKTADESVQGCAK